MKYQLIEIHGESNDLKEILEIRDIIKAENPDVNLMVRRLDK